MRFLQLLFGVSVLAAIASAGCAEETCREVSGDEQAFPPAPEPGFVDGEGGLALAYRQWTPDG